MPATAVPPAPPETTALQAEISAKTAAAVQDTGFGKEFDAEFDAALAIDEAARAAKTGDKPPAAAQPAATPAAPAKPVTEKPVATPAPDIPDALLGKKKADEAPKGDVATDVEREKFIKEQTAGLSPKAADRFRSIEARAHAAEQRVKQSEKLEKELAAAQERLKTASDNTESKALKKQLEELDEIVQKNALADHPKFKATFDNQIAKEVATAKKLVPAEAAAEVEALLSLPDTAQRNRRLNEILQELQSLEAGKLQGAIDRVDRLAADKAAELGNWKQNKTRMLELAQKDANENQEQRQAVVEKALKTVLPKFTNDENGIELFRKAEGNEEWNKSVESRLENVKKITAADLSREDVAEMAAWAMSGAEYRKLFLTQRALVTKLQEEIASLKGGEPDLGEGAGALTDDEEKGGMLDVVTRIATKAGAVR